MVSATNIDLSGALEAHLSYKYRIENADPGESHGYFREFRRWR